MRDAKRRQRIKDRVDYRLRRGDAAGLGCALDAEQLKEDGLASRARVSLGSRRRDRSV